MKAVPTRTERPAGPSAAAVARAVLLTRSTDADFFTRTAAAYPGIAHTNLAGTHLYFLSRPDLAHQLLVCSGRTRKGRGLQGARRILGEGLLTSDEPRHRTQRRLVGPMFDADHVRGAAAQIAAVVAETDNRWCDGHRVAMTREMARLTLSVVMRVLFGVQGNREPDTFGLLSGLLRDYNKSLRPWFGVLMAAGTPVARRVTTARAALDDVVATLGRSAAPDSPAAQLAAGMSPTQWRDEMLTTVLAGGETTAVALTFAWYLCHHNPDAATWLREELDALRSGRTGNSIAAAATNNELPRTRAFVAETMRLFPPAWVLGRQLTGEITLDGWRIPAGSTCLTSQWVLHRDARFWDDAGRFRPQRWLDSDGRFSLTAPGITRHAYFPFGAGSRICVGEAFAWTEAVIALATLAGRWSALPCGGRLRLAPAMTLRPAGEVPMTVIRR